MATVRCVAHLGRADQQTREDVAGDAADLCTGLGDEILRARDFGVVQVADLLTPEVLQLGIL